MQMEEYHKVQISGAWVEGCQVQTVEKTAALVELLSVISARLRTRKRGDDGTRFLARSDALGG